MVGGANALCWRIRDPSRAPTDRAVLLYTLRQLEHLAFFSETEKKAAASSGQ